MLFGQDLRRCHEGDLKVVLHRDEGGQERHDCLACADVTLQHPVHRPTALKVVDNFLESELLPIR